MTEFPTSLKKANCLLKEKRQQLARLKEEQINWNLICNQTTSDSTELSQSTDWLNNTNQELEAQESELVALEQHISDLESSQNSETTLLRTVLVILLLPIVFAAAIANRFGLPIFITAVCGVVVIVMFNAISEKSWLTKANSAALATATTSLIQPTSFTEEDLKAVQNKVPDATRLKQLSKERIRSGAEMLIRILSDKLKVADGPVSYNCYSSTLDQQSVELAAAAYKSNGYSVSLSELQCKDTEYEHITITISLK